MRIVLSSHDFEGESLSNQRDAMSSSSHAAVSGKHIEARRPAALAVVLLFTVAAPLHAQTRNEGEPHASFTAGASFGDGGTALALSVGVGLPLASRIRAEIEIAYTRKLDFTLDVCPPPLVCVVGGRIPVTGRTLALVPQLAVELLPSSHRLQVYLQAGPGGGHVRQRYMFGPPFSSTAGERTRSNLTLAFAFGGGASMRVARRLTIGVDLRSLHLRDDPAPPERFIMPAGTLSTLRAGLRAAWRF